MAPIHDFESTIRVRVRPPLDPGFMPAILWNRAYEARCRSEARATPLQLALTRPDGKSCFHWETLILPPEGDNASLTFKYVERAAKSLLWQKGGSRIFISGSPATVQQLKALYAPGGARAFDAELIGRRVFGEALTIAECAPEDVPAQADEPVFLGRNFDGCRIGFDLGGSDRKCAAVIDGRVVFSDEVAWDPYFQHDPRYHYEGIMDSIRRAQTHLPRVDAVGGSAAGVYVDNEPRAGSLFRGVSDADFAAHVRPMFHRIQTELGHIPFNVVNDGEVTALAGAIALERNNILGVAMGTSQAAGFCDANGHITNWLNELAFVPVDYRGDAPVDEWSRDCGCGVQYFSQQAVVRLAPAAGLELPEDMPFAEQLLAVQKRMAEGDLCARRIYETLGVYFGYAVAQYVDMYDMDNVMLLGRVTSGEGGQVLLEQARRVLDTEFPTLAERITLVVPDEKSRRVGQAVAAASLPGLADNRRRTGRDGDALKP